MLPLNKNKFLIMLSGMYLGIVNPIVAQNTPDLSQTSPAGTANQILLPPPITVPGGKLNYEREYIPRLPITNANTLNNTASDLQVKTTYIDGFKRDMQVIAKNFLQGRHLVLPIDTRFQKDQYDFLPYTTTSLSSFNPSPFSQQQSFYLSYQSGEGAASYGLKREYSDAMDKMILTYPAGKSQVGQGRGTTLRQVTNAANEVRMWSLNGTGMPITSSYYAPGELFGEKINSSQGAESLIYKDKDGKVIYEKKYLEDGTVEGGGVAAIYGITQYVYDELGNLRYTIPPKAGNFVTGGTLDQTVLDNLCFQYRYDSRGLKIEQKFPGQGMEYFVYDKRKRLVFHQDALLRGQNKWAFKIFDAFDRPICGGVCESADTRQTVQGYIDDNITYQEPNLLYYQKNYQLYGVYPQQITNSTPLTYTYYDDYKMSDPTGALWNTYNNDLQFTELQNLPGSETPQRSNRIQGKVTGTKIKVMPSPNADPTKTGDWIENAYYYDDKGRPIYVVSRTLYQNNPIYIHYSGNQFDFSDRLMLNKHVVINTFSSDGIYRHSELNRNVYDGLTGRLTQTRHKVDNGPFNVTSIYDYDELGRTKRKVLGNYGEVQDFSYNIRGQLTGINSQYAETGNTGGESRSFGASLKYDYGFSQPRYDGKLSGLVWRGAGNSQAMAYGYSYDRSGRLTTADYRRYEPPSGSYLGYAWRKDLSDYSVSNLRYDNNGNLQSMAQRGLNATGQPDFIDRLKYTYESQSNKLIAVQDTVTTDFGRGDFQDGNTGLTDYQYDPNGNLSYDKNKNIVNVSYTYLNKPQRIEHGNQGYIEYSYDAAGNKLQEISYNIAAGATDIIDQVGNFVYKNNGLQYVQTIDGRSVYNKVNQTFKEEYFVKDHLGNVHSVIDVFTYPTQEYLATYEVASANLENLFFEKIDEVRDDKPGSTWNGDLKSARLNGADPSRTTGTSALLKVMVGDKVDMTVNSFYENYTRDIDDRPLSPDDLLANVISTLTGGTGGMPGEAHNTKIVDKAFTQANYGIFDQIVQANTDPSQPKAYLNYILFDENMKIVEGSSGVFQANGNGTWTQIGTTTPLVMPVNGYLAVYLNNRSRSTNCLACTDVFFDQLVLRFTRGSLKEEAHYYPHGLPIAGMGSAAQGFVENRKKYQTNDYNENFKLNWMNFYARQYDPQLGKFLSIDPLADDEGQQIFSPYAAMGNNPGMMVDPFGTTFTVSGDMKMAGEMLNSWLGAGNYKLDGNVVRLIAGKEDDAFRNLTEFFTKLGIGASGGSAEATAKWVMSMITDQNRTINAKVQNNGRVYFDAVNETGLRVNSFSHDEIEMYSSIESGVNQKSKEGSNVLSGPSNGYFYATLTPSLIGSFVNDTKFGRWASMGGAAFSLSRFNTQKALMQEFSITSKYVSGATKALGWAGAGITLASDAVGVRNYFKYGPNSPNAVSPFHMAVDGGATYIGIYGGWPGALISGAYFMASPVIWFTPGPTAPAIVPTVDALYVAPR